MFIYYVCGSFYRHAYVIIILCFENFNQKINWSHLNEVVVYTDERMLLLCVVYLFYYATAVAVYTPVSSLTVYRPAVTHQAALYQPFTHQFIIKAQR